MKEGAGKRTEKGQAGSLGLINPLIIKLTFKSDDARWIQNLLCINYVSSKNSRESRLCFIFASKYFQEENERALE